jgi:uncharacterized protein YndB with AHSA1/START domain
MSDELVLHARLAAPPGAVYRALTDADALRTWLAEHADVALGDGRYAFWGRHTPQGEQPRQRLLDARPDEALSFSWDLDGQETTVRIGLEPDGDRRTQLTLRQDGLPTLDELMKPTGRRDGLHSMHTFWGLALANLAEHCAGRATSLMADFSQERPAVIRAELTLDASPERVFASLVDPEQIERWFGWRAEVEPRVGGRMTLGVEGRISEFEPGKILVYGDDEGAVVRWELADSGGRTHLTFVQSGFSPAELDSAAQHEAGWLAGLVELRRMHELGAEWQPLTTELPSGPEA